MNWPAARLDMLAPRAVAHLAAFRRRDILRTLHCGEVRRLREPEVLIRVTYLTRIRPDIIINSRG